MKKYYYLVQNKANGNRYIMLGNMRNTNIGMGKHLFNIVAETDKGIDTPYGKRSNITNGLKYNFRQHKIIHQTEVK